MIIVSDTSPLVNLAAVRHLNLLQQLYGQVIIPQAVYDEIVAGTPQPGSAEVKSSWIEVRRTTLQSLTASLRLELDEGEAEAIALATELNANLLLLDERKGREVAARMGIRFVGVLGVLVDAKRKNFVPAVKPIVDELISKAGFWISPQLYNRILESVGE